MSTNSISFNQTNYFSSLILDFVDGNAKAKTFYKFNQLNFDIEETTQQKNKEPIDRKILVGTIKKQYAHIDNMPSVLVDNINGLNKPNSFCVVTAHQLNIFAGPLYCIYKIAQTISTCNSLQHQYANYNFVPVFWLGSEDHDFDEINHIHLFQKKITWNDTQSGATGFFSTEKILPLIDEIKTILGNQPYTDELIQLFENAYAEPDLTKATRHLVNKLFGCYGLVVIDGNDAVFKKQFSSIMQNELLNNDAYNLVQQTIQQLHKHNYKTQATPREINLFYLRDNRRERIVFDNEKKDYHVLNADIYFTKDEILQELNTFPERFSPNVILRPLFQQRVLPSVAYIGGAGEIAYWLQLQSTFEYYSIHFPILLLRNSALLFSSTQLQKINKLDLNVADFFNDLAFLKSKFIEQNKTFNIDDEKNTMLLAFKKIKDKSMDIDKSLDGLVGAEINKLEKSFEHIESKINKSLKQQHENALHQIDKIYQQFFPNHSLQERVENFSSYYSQYGQSFIDKLIKEFDVFSKQFLIIEL